MDTLFQRLEIAVIQLLAHAEVLLFPPRTLGTKLPPAPVAPGVRNPVIIVHGICDSATGSQDLARSLRRDGWTVFTPTMPGNGMFGVERNARALAAEVARVQALTGAAQIDLIGHSQGGLDIRWFMGFVNTTHNIGRVVTLNSPHHGVAGAYATAKREVTAFGFPNLLPSGLMELVVGSAMLRKLATIDESPGSAAYTAVRSQHWDGIVYPWSSPILAGARNIVLTEPSRGRWLRSQAGPHHIDVNHTSEEAYAAVRDALLGATAPRSVPAPAQGNAQARPARRRRRPARS